MLKVVHPVCCGVNFHKNFIVPTIDSIANLKGKISTYKSKRFSTFNDELNLFKYWLIENCCRELYINSTGEYWITFYNVLEPSLIITLANLKYVRAIKGKKKIQLATVYLNRKGVFVAEMQT